MLAFYKPVLLCFPFYVQTDYEEGTLLELEALLSLYIVVLMCVPFSMQTDHEEGDPHPDRDEGRQGADVRPRGGPDRAGGGNPGGAEGQHAADH